MPHIHENRHRITRRSFVQDGAAALLATAVLNRQGLGTQLPAGVSGSARETLSLDQRWLFGAARSPVSPSGATELTPVTLPHGVAPLSWKNWKPSQWEGLWVYQRHFQIPPAWRGKRIFLHFDRVMAGAHPSINGKPLRQHLGGFLPFDYEITPLVKHEDNLLSVTVDARWLNAPPSGSPKGPGSIDYLLPGGITASVSLYAVPAVFIRDVFAKPVAVLDRTRRLDISCSLDGDMSGSGPYTLQAVLADGERIIAQATQVLTIGKAVEPIPITLDRLGNISLWDIEAPRLYTLSVILSLKERPLDAYQTRIGFREARFELDGFFLNGRRVQIFGLNRHELYPYIGFAAPPRLLRRDAQLLRHTLNCNMVRCSHYPQSEAFLDACDELGLMVWEEIPGWQYIGDASWQDLALRDVETMIRRDRNHAAVVIWGVRINESPNNPRLYQRTREIAVSLDGSRPTSGTMTPSSMKGWPKEWRQDVLAFDDYHASGTNSVDMAPPPPGAPYLVTEAVGQFDYTSGKGFDSQYRRAGDPQLQARQAVYHAEAHDRGAANARCSGVIAWCALDYASLMNAYDGVKCPGIADVFRHPKLGAAFYQAQVDPKVHSVIEPSFYWDFGERMPAGPGKAAVIFSNCERLDLFLNGRMHAVLHSDKAAFPHLKYPPFFANLDVDGTAKPELRIEGYSGGKLLLVRRFSSDPSTDRLWLKIDDAELRADGSDSTRLAFGVVDRFGAPRAFAGGDVTLGIRGPAILVGDNPFNLDESGGSGAVWIKSIAGRSGVVEIDARHPSFKPQSVILRVLHAET